MDKEKIAISDPLTDIQAELATVVQAVTMDDFTSFVQLFSDINRRMFFSGQGRSGLIAQMTAMRFMHLGYRSHFVGDVTAPSVRDGDAILFISGSGTTPATVRWAKTARCEGACVGAITSDLNSDLAQLADFALHLRTDHTRQFGGSLFEQSSLIVLDSITMHLAGQNVDAKKTMAHRHSNLQ